jgi:hypothetical protein
MVILQFSPTLGESLQLMWPGDGDAERQKSKNMRDSAGGDHNFSTRVYEVEGRSIKGSDLLVNLQI